MATTVATPGVTPVTTPELRFTVAIAVAELCQMTGRLANTAPAASK